MSEATTLLDLLAQRHADDVFVPECKDGPTQGGTHVRLDAWAMKRSWSKPWTYGYEIKVSRSDFLKDDKWPAYLPLCNYFAFVCPHGLIEKREVPEGCGLLYATKTGTRLVTKLKPVHRDVAFHEGLARYVLMARSRVTAPGFYDNKPQDHEARSRYWRRWLAEKEESRSLGHRVSSAIQEHVARVEAENHRLKRAHGRYESVRKRIAELGFDPETEVSSWEVERKLEQLAGVLPPGFARVLRRHAKALEDAAQAVEGLSE